jgi:type IV secretion system protein VirB10
MMNEHKNDKSSSLLEEDATQVESSAVKGETKIDEQGMPLIREDETSRRILIGLMVLVMMLMMYLLIHHLLSSKKKDAEPQVAEESYSVPQDDISKNANAAVPVSPIINNSEKSSSAALYNPAQAMAQQQRLEFIQAKQKELQERLTAPLLIVKNPSENKALNGTTKPLVSGNENTDFMNQVSAQQPDTVQATHLQHLNYLITQGHLIHAVLESAINSDLPGYIRAEVREPVYAEDGSQVLIPVGSRLIGQYRSGMTQGQSRVFVVWSRVITPNGVSVNLGSPGVDNLGVAGVDANHIDRHFWAQFGNAILLSIISAGAANVDVSPNDQYNAAQAYRSAMANSFSDTASQSLKKAGVIAPTLTIQQGRPIMVFVAHDLNFEPAMQQTSPQWNVF